MQSSKPKSQQPQKKPASPQPAAPAPEPAAQKMSSPAPPTSQPAIQPPQSPGASRSGSPRSPGAAMRFRGGNRTREEKERLFQHASLPSWRVRELRERDAKFKPLTQQATDRGHAICLCPAFHDCEKAATLHPKDTCDYCYGIRSKVFPQGKIDRYYPGDTNWEDLRSMCVQLRRYCPELPNEFGVDRQ